MGYDLIPKNKRAGCPNGMISIWPVILQETGACYLFGYGKHTAKPGYYVYDGNRGPGSPVSNDGFKVSRSEAKAMAKLFRGYVSVKRSIRQDWESMSDAERMCMLEIDKNSIPPCEEFINKVESLIEFCEQSGGFKIT